MSELYIGLMSGTSVDGVDAAIVDFSLQQPRLLATHYHAYADNLRHDILSLCQPSHDEINRMGELDVRLGKLFAAVVCDLLKKHPVDKKKIRAIGSHGQTIRHHPHKQFTLQIGDPNIIAAETGITTVADFRRRDLALGGQGAPLVPKFHHAIFSSTDVSRVIVNIGGIANITILPKHGQVIGFDTGPGNTLLDAWAEKHLQKKLDENGQWASQGSVNIDILQKLLNDSFFKKAAPKSTGREYFNLAWLSNFFTAAKPVDIQATLTELTARTIITAIENHLSEGEVLICGGGAHNVFLMQRLKAFGGNYSIDTTAKYGVNPDWVEAMAFAWLARQTLNNQAGNLPPVTGASQSCLLGGIYP